ncbi:MAG: DEAD/DEAH box helicase, partial [Paludibacter sp.]|nr:DEAD/DEAH box helicase [Paludibacter sp.]
ATPGRLISHINLYDIDFSGVKYFILDEADRMLDMGFYDDIMLIVKRLPKERQTIMFSATMPPKIRTLAKTILHNPTEVKIAVSRPPESIEQTAYICHETQKQGIIRHLFADKEISKVLIFSGSKLKVKELFKTFHKMGLSVGEMHSDLDQSQRDHIMHEFKNNRVSILVATDIVSRGIDIDDITMVINYDVPHDAEDYVHRIGRTARASAKGKSITFVSEEEQYKFKRIEDFLEKEITRLAVPAALGEAPAYNPTIHRHGNKQFGGKKGTFHRNRKPAQKTKKNIKPHKSQ